MRVFALTLLTLSALLTLTREAAATDARALYDERCAECHISSQELVEVTLVIKDGVLKSATSGTDMRKYLTRHRGRLNAEEVAAVYDLLFAQLVSCPSTPELGRGGFQAKCALCHVSAKELVRERLVRDADGTVRGRYTGESLAQFLASHGRTCSDDVNYFVNMLTTMTPQGEPKP